MKSLLLQIRDHLCRIAEAGGREFVIRTPVGLKPARIEVNNVAGNAVLPELGGHIPHFILRFVGDAAHPEAEGPERRDGAAPGQRRVL